MSAVEGDRLLQLRFPARAERLRLVRAVIGEAAVASGCGERCVGEIVLAVDEACQNIIRHGYAGDPAGEILLDMRREGDRLVFELVDFADPVDASAVKPRPLDEIRPGGLGTHFIQECMDEARFRKPPRGAGNLLRMVKRIA